MIVHLTLLQVIYHKALEKYVEKGVYCFDAICMISETI